MKIRYQIIIFAFVVCVLGGIVWSASHYHDKYQAERLRADAAELNLSLANSAITDMETRQRDVAALDAKYTGELQDAKATIDQLERDVANGKRRLQLNAKCATNGAPGTSGMDDGASPRLTDSAERGYFTLRERIETVTKQLTGLQEYVRTQCLN